MSLIIASGSNLDHSLHYLALAKTTLEQHFKFIAQSRVYKSAAVDYEDQPDFFNQVLEFELPSKTPEEVMLILLEIEKNMGRTREVLRGPRKIDLDIVFWGLESHSTQHVVIPHPRWMERSFVIRPLQELPFFKSVEKCFTIPKSFIVEAHPV
jgi:2-amino-4-hydroxy-6-hydroxymethyldihydropteridine diphosphokinase